MTQSGWYPDPSDGNQQRYWDGTQWTEHRAPAQPPQSAQPLYGGTPQLPYGGPPQATPYAGYYTGAVRSTSGKAITSLVLGILGLVTCAYFTGVPAMFVARSAIRDIDASGGVVQGRGLATAGFWTGLAATVIYGLLTVLLIIGLATGSGSSSSG